MNVAATEAITLRLRIARAGFSLEVDLALPARGVSALFGPSGAGKTTILRALAGLERSPGGGYVEVAGQIWQDEARSLFVPPHGRSLGYVFQEANLFPHLPVRQNILYGRRRAGARASTFPVDPAHAIDLLGIAHLLDRDPGTLSGGERQRVAIARALLAGPRLLLLDEPLASLDSDRKREVLPYLERLHDELKIPVVLVTHALDEVLRLADHLVLIRSGRVVASGPLREVLSRLDLPEIRTQDPGVVLEGRVVACEAGYGLLEVQAGGARLWLAHAGRPAGSRLRLQVHSRDVSLSLEKPRDTSVLNVLPATVIRQDGGDDEPHVHVLLEAGGIPLVARITRLSRDRLQLQTGTAVWALIKAVAVVA